MAIESIAPEREPDRQGAQLLEAIDAAEQALVALMRRERAAARAGHRLAASALRSAVGEAARALTGAFVTAHQALPGLSAAEPALARRLENRRRITATRLRIELSALAAMRASGLGQSPAGAAAPRAGQAELRAG